MLCSCMIWVQHGVQKQQQGKCNLSVDLGQQLDDVHAWSGAVMLMIRSSGGNIGHKYSSQDELKKSNVQALSSVLMRRLHCLECHLQRYLMPRSDGS